MYNYQLPIKETDAPVAFFIQKCKNQAVAQVASSILRALVQIAIQNNTLNIFKKMCTPTE